jgi:hypothetical protein
MGSRVDRSILLGKVLTITIAELSGLGPLSSDSSAPLSQVSRVS